LPSIGFQDRDARSRGSGAILRARADGVKHAITLKRSVTERAWLASDQLSGKLLRPILPALLTALATHQGLGLTPEPRAALTTASAATLDRLLRPLRRRRARPPRRLAPALASLRAQVPLRTWSEWAGVRPGAVQGDLVLHCGESTAGQYCATRVAVDVATT
jgi:hypothetical protein